MVGQCQFEIMNLQITVRLYWGGSFFIAAVLIWCFLMFILNKIWVYWICIMQDSLGLNSEVSEISDGHLTVLLTLAMWEKVIYLKWNFWILAKKKINTKPCLCAVSSSFFHDFNKAGIEWKAIAAIRHSLWFSWVLTWPQLLDSCSRKSAFK